MNHRPRALPRRRLRQRQTLPTRRRDNGWFAGADKARPRPPLLRRHLRRDPSTTPPASPAPASRPDSWHMNSRRQHPPPRQRTEAHSPSPSASLHGAYDSNRDRQYTLARRKGVGYAPDAARARAPPLYPWQCTYCQLPPEVGPRWASSRPSSCNCILLFGCVDAKELLEPTWPGSPVAHLSSVRDCRNLSSFRTRKR